MSDDNWYIQMELFQFVASKLRIFFEGLHFRHEVIKERVILNEPSLPGTT